MSRLRCCVMNCYSTQEDGPLYRFPRKESDPDRFFLWWQATGRGPFPADKEKIKRLALRICNKHFRPQDVSEKRLRWKSVPIINFPTGPDTISYDGQTVCKDIDVGPMVKKNCTMTLPLPNELLRRQYSFSGFSSWLHDVHNTSNSLPHATFPLNSDSHSVPPTVGDTDSLLIHIMADHCYAATFKINPSSPECTSEHCKRTEACNLQGSEMAANYKDPQLTITSEKLLRDSLDRMRRDRKLCDVIIIARDIEIPAHKCVLASCSSYFYSMFVNSPCKIEERIEMNVNPDILHSIIEYFYTSQLTISERTLKDTLEIAKLLLLDNVQMKCCNFLRRIINTNNSLYVKTLATTYGDFELLTEISSFIEANFVDIATSDEFLNLTNNEVKELICKDSLKVPYEEKIYECMTRWIKHDLKERRKYLRSLIECVRLRFISKKYLKEHIVNDPLLAGDMYCKDLIIKALLENEMGSSFEIKHRKYARVSQVMLVIGGETKESQNTLEFYDFERGFWSEVLKIPFSIQDARLEVVNQKVYLIGGTRDNKPVQTVSCYNLALNSWYDIPDMMEKRTGHGVTELNNSIYVFGGFDGLRSLNSGEKFCHEGKKWLSIAQMSKNRWRFGTCVANDIVYVVGGYDGTCVLNSVESYDHRQNEWSQLRGMKECRTGLGLCTVDGIIYAIGGWNPDGGVLQTAEKYNPKTDSWAEISSMNYARTHVDVAVKDNCIYVVGGSDLHTSTTVTNSIEVYNVKTNTWIMLPKLMNVPRSFHCVAMVDLINMHLKC